MKTRCHLLACLLVLLTSACSITSDFVRSNPVMPATTSNSGIDVLQQANRIKTMSATELAAEADSLQKAFAARRNEDNRLRLALFLAIAPPPLGDRARALSLLDVAPSEVNGRGRTHPLAQLLLQLLQDNRRLEQDNRRLELDNHRLDEALTANLQKQRELQQGNEAMRQKLEAISDIEVKMQERPKPK